MELPSPPAPIRPSYLPVNGERHPLLPGALHRLRADRRARSQELNLQKHEVVTDALLACGLGAADADDIAGCGQRFAEQDDSSLELVVFCGEDVAGLAHVGGLCFGNCWQPVGRKSIPVLVIPGDAAHSHVVDEVASKLGRTPSRPTQSRTTLSPFAHLLKAALGDYGGRGSLTPGGNWSRERGRLTVADLREHLLGHQVVQAYDPRGPWPYVVLDLDRHGALQEWKFHATLAWIKKEFRSSLIVESSESRGVHVYVCLPPDTLYQHAATWLRLFVTAEGQRWVRQGAVQAEVIEVPRHPVRLPFGRGSSIRGSTLPLGAQIKEFLAFLARADSSDYARAKASAIRKAGIPAEWSPAHRRRMAEYMAQRELKVARKTALPGADPWSRILPQLPPYLVPIAANGVPSLGTRGRWTMELVRSLVDIAPRAEVESLMKRWLNMHEDRGASDHLRNHLSEDIELRPGVALEQTLRMIEARYDSLAGLPISVWKEIKRHVLVASNHHARARTGRSWLASTASIAGQTARRSYHAAEVLKTAFFVARRFFDQGNRTRRILREEFEEFTLSNSAADMRRLFTYGGTWLKPSAPPIQGVAGTEFELAGALWPAVPGEPVLFCPP